MVSWSLKKSEKTPTEQLVVLRDHLIALGKAEPLITSIANDKTESISKAEEEPTPDLSVLQLLQLWEKIFRETFQEYHRLSSRLVQTEESSTVLKLWKDYLAHVNQFLDSEPPQHYHELSEQVQLCQVHHNVLSCQKSLVPTQKTGLDDSVVQQFNLLTNVHNETLSRIMDKQTQIQDRIKAWEKYRKDQTDLLNWLKDAENDRNKLKLHYISAKTLPKTLVHMQDLLKKLKEGEEMDKALNLQLTEILKFCDDNLKNTLSVEHSSISHRLTNLQAALLTWKDYLNRVKEGIENYERQINKIQNNMKEIQNNLKQDSESPVILIPHGQLKKRMTKLEKVSKSVDALTGDIRALEDSRDALKDSLTPTEVKLMSQRCWLISQQQCDISHQLAMAILALEDRLQLSSLFDKRLERILSWAADVDVRLERMTSQGYADARQALRRLETEIQAETTLRKREVDWLNKTGEELLAVEEVGSKRAVKLESDLKKLKEVWGTVLTNTDARASKLRAIMQGISDLDTQIEELRIWLQEIETKLSASIVIKYAKKEHIDQILKNHDEIQKEIEKQSTRIGEVLNLCELLLSDCNSCHITLDDEGINLAMINLEKRWKMICVNSAERKAAILSLWTKIQQIIKRVQEQRIWLEEMEKLIKEQEDLFERNCSIENIVEISQEFTNLENELKQGINDRLVPLDSMYRHLLREYTLPDEVMGLPEELCEKADLLLKRVNEGVRYSGERSALLEQFTRAQAKAVTAMAKCDGLLTMAQLSVDSGAIPSDIESSIQKIEKELKDEASTLSEADSSGLEVMKWTNDKDMAKIQTMIDEYQDLWKDINRRLGLLKDSSIVPKQMADRGVEVNTLKFEMDRSTQVDTLGWSSPIVRKDAFISELHKTCTEFETLLIKLQKLEQFDTHQKISKCIGQCVSSFELAQHLSQNLKDQCNANDNEAMVPKLKTLGEEFAKIKQQAQEKLQQLREASAHGKLSCPLCSNKNWQQLDNDLWRLEQWLQYAEGTLASQPSTPPSSIEQLEDAIQDQRELLLDLDSHRSLVVSMNIVGTHLAEHSDSEERAQELRNRLAKDNAKWDQVCEAAAAWQAKLQLALIQNEEFHETIEEMTEWVEKTEVTVRQSEPIDLNEPSHLIQAKYDKFKDLRHELERCEPRILSLEEAARQVLSHQQEENTTVNLCQQRLTNLRLRLQSLSRLTALYMGRLAGGANTSQRLPSLDTLSQQLLDSTVHGEEQNNGNEVDTSTLVRCHRFFGRVMRASVPISAFLLLLLGAATLLPTTQQDFSCLNMFYNLAPILRYPNGHPPI